MKAGRCKTTANKIRPRRKNTKRKHVLTNKTPIRKVDTESSKDRRHNQTEASFPTSISWITSVFSHIQSKDRSISHLIIHHKNHKIQLNVNHVKLLTEKSQHTCEEYIRSIKEPQEGTGMKIVNSHTSPVSHTKKKTQGVPYRDKTNSGDKMVQPKILPGNKKRHK